MSGNIVVGQADHYSPSLKDMKVQEMPPAASQQLLRSGQQRGDRRKGQKQIAQYQGDYLHITFASLSPGMQILQTKSRNYQRKVCA